MLLWQDVTRHMVTIVKNVSRSMTEISCYADNGYGTPMQSSVSITVSREWSPGEGKRGRLFSPFVMFRGPPLERWNFPLRLGQSFHSELVFLSHLFFPLLDAIGPRDCRFIPFITIFRMIKKYLKLNELKGHSAYAFSLSFFFFWSSLPTCQVQVEDRHRPP